MKYLGSITFLCFVLLVGCMGNTKKTNDHDSKETSSVTLQVDEKIDVKFPVYNFDEFEPLLHKDDSTTYVINFWATWCKPCIEELPYFEKVNTAYEDDNVKVILVSLDMPNMWKSRLEPFVEKKELHSEVVILDDPKQNDWIPKVSEEWGGGIPATLIYNGQKRSFFERGFTYEELTEQLTQFIN